MSWRDNLRTASFRGVTFQVEGHDFTTGRRGPTHEYPQRDKPFFEDLGRRARGVTIEAYVIGDDYMRQRDRLVAACEEEGAATLVHPYLGSFEAACTECRVSERVTEGRMARFSLTFVESGALTFPTDGVDTSAAVQLEADKLAAAAQAAFADAHTLDGLPGYVGDSSEEAALEISEAIEAGGADAESLEAFAADIPSLVRDATGFASRVTSLVSLVRTVSTNPVAAMQGLSTFAVSALDSIPSTTATRLRQRTNLDAIGGLVRRSALAGEAVALTQADFASYQDAFGQVQNFSARVSDEILTGEAQNDPEVFNSLEALRAATVTDVQTRAGDLAKVTSVKLVSARPALVTAYDLYEDATRDEELATRNGVTHPSWMPPDTELEALSE